VELAIKGGGPDNITCIVADVVDTDSAPRPPSEVSVLAGAASNGAPGTRLRTNSPAGRAHVLTQTAPQAAVVIDHDDPAPRAATTAPGGGAGHRRRWPIVTSVLLLLVIVIVGGGYAGWRYTQDQYYVGAHDGQVVIFRGVNQTVAGIALSHVFEHTGIPLDKVPTTDKQSITSTILATSLADARRIVGNVRSGYQACQTAYSKRAAYVQKLQQYRTALAAYKKKYGTDKPKKVHGKTVHPPTPPKGPKPAIPPDCPAQATGSGGSS
jgi:PPM family protein phosphatase